jgi:hypothetical protein
MSEKEERKKRKHEKKDKKKKDKKKKEKRKRESLSSTKSITASNNDANVNESPKKKKQHVRKDLPPPTPQQNHTNNAHDEEESSTSIHNGSSPFQEKKVRILVSLPPSSLVNIPNAMNTSMQNLLLKYSNGLGGVLVSYRDIELDNSTSKSGEAEAGGRIINEMPHIHYYIKCTVLIFVPSIGTVLRGKVNESFPSHVGVLVHELFNGMISAESLRKNGFVFDDESNEWRKNDVAANSNESGDDDSNDDNDSNDDDNGREGRVITVDDAMEFTIDKLHECNGLISLECTDPSFLDTTKQ